MRNLAKYKLSHQLLSAIILLAIVIFTLIYNLSQYYVHSFTEDLGKQTLEGIYKDVNTFLSAESQRLENLTVSHAYWSELVQAAEKRDIEWIHQNATAYLVNQPSYNLNIYFIEDQTGYLDTYGYLPHSLFNKISSQLTPQQLLSGPTTYLIQYNSELFLVSVCGLSNSEADQVFGTYILGSRVDQQISKSLTNRYDGTLRFNLDLVSKENLVLYPMKLFQKDQSIRELYHIELTSYDLSDDINIEADKLLAVILLILFITALFVLLFLIRISSNLELSINRIKGITYNDYTEKLSLDFSKDFVELSDCINELSHKLETKDEAIQKRHIEMITTLLITLEEVDLYTKGHSERVSHYAVMLAAAMGYESYESIRIAGLLHDVGKISIPSKILNKPDRLTTEEFDEIKKHPSAAFNILNVSDSFEEVKYLVLHHHERYDGSGYPDGLKGNDIPQGAMIIALADVFDSLTSQRSYREPLSYSDAIALMSKDSGTHFDPEVFDVFLQISARAYNRFSGLNKLPTEEELIL